MVTPGAIAAVTVEHDQGSSNAMTLHARSAATGSMRDERGFRPITATAPSARAAIAITSGSGGFTP